MSHHLLSCRWVRPWKLMEGITVGSGVAPRSRTQSMFYYFVLIYSAHSAQFESVTVWPNIWLYFECDLYKKTCFYSLFFITLLLKTKLAHNGQLWNLHEQRCWMKIWFLSLIPRPQMHRCAAEFPPIFPPLPIPGRGSAVNHDVSKASNN